MNTEAFISRRSSGMSFDFSTRDPRIYIAGTEDGPIHKCSTSYSEQYLETYMGHKVRPTRERRRRTMSPFTQTPR